MTLETFFKGFLALSTSLSSRGEEIGEEERKEIGVDGGVPKKHANDDESDRKERTRC